MNLPRYDSQTGERIEYSKPKDVYSVSEIIFAWFCLIIGYLFCRVFPVISHPFGGFLFIVLILVVTIIFQKCRGVTIGIMPTVLSVSALLLAPSLFICANEMFQYLVYNYAILAWIYSLYAANGGALEKGWSDLLLIDFFKALFISPILSFGKMIPTLFSGKGKRRGAVLKVLLGLAIAIVPTALVLALLSYDKSFTDLFGKIFAFDWGDLFSHFISIVLGVPIGMYFYGAFFSSEHKKDNDQITVSKCREMSAQMRLLPLLTSLVATIPLLVVYGVFFASQWGYYTSAFTGVLPENITYAEYAREGFFQLCAVSVINLILITLLQVFVRRFGEKPALQTRILSVVFSVATLILMITAFSKLFLYIKQFGLTPKRLYAGWFMGILAVIFLLVILKQFIQRFKLLPTAFLACVVLFAVLALSGSDTLIAEYNVNRYLDGSLDTIDISAMQDLGDAAVPSMVRAGETLAKKQGTTLSPFHHQTYDGLYGEVSRYFHDHLELYRAPLTIYSFTLPRARAEKALKSAGIDVEAIDFERESIEGVTN